MNKISLIIADDHSLIRNGLKNILFSNPSVVLIGEASDGQQALDMIIRLQPQVAILDIEMPLLNGLKVCEAVKKEKLPTKVIFLTMFKEADLYRQALKMDVNGYLLKDSAAEEVNIAIAKVVSGEFYMSRNLDETLIHTKSMLLLDSKIKDQIRTLTKSEKDILLLIAQQLNSKSIADKLYISEKTVKKHRHNIAEKLGLDGNQNSLLKFALENNAYLT